MTRNLETTIISHYSQSHKVGRTVIELGDLSQVSVHLVAALVSWTTATRLSLSYPSSAISNHASLDPSGEKVKPEIAPWSCGVKWAGLAEWGCVVSKM